MRHRPIGAWCKVACVAAALAIATGATSRAQTAKPQRYHEKIDGTLVTFEMLPVPGGDGVQPFYIGVTEVTWDMYDVFALELDRGAAAGKADAIARPSNPYGAPDYGWGHAGFPVMSVTRAAAEAFCTWLSLKTGKAYRLPTEAEWTRAAQLAGGPALTDAERDTFAWHRGNADGRTHAVGTKSPDRLGLLDLFGNVGEWVTPTDAALVLRGGSFRDARDTIGVTSRAVQDPSWNETDPQLPKSKWWLSDAPFAGFRIVRSQ